MVEESQNDIMMLLFFVGVIILLMLLISFYVNVWIPFVTEKNYIKMELLRATGRRKKYWKMQLRHLYVKHIPILGKIISKRF